MTKLTTKSMSGQSECWSINLVSSLIVYGFLSITKKEKINLVKSKMRYIKFGFGINYLLYNTLRTATNLISL